MADVWSLKKGIAGCEKVFHCAGALRFWKQKRLPEQVNIEGTQNIVIACQQSGVTCRVYISAAAVIFNGGPIKAIDESAPIPQKPFGDYARTKAIVAGSMKVDIHTTLVTLKTSAKVPFSRQSMGKVEKSIF